MPKPRRMHSPGLVLEFLDKMNLQNEGRQLPCPKLKRQQRPLKPARRPTGTTFDGQVAIMTPQRPMTCCNSAARCGKPALSQVSALSAQVLETHFTIYCSPSLHRHHRHTIARTALQPPTSPETMITTIFFIIDCRGHVKPPKSQQLSA